LAAYGCEVGEFAGPVRWWITNFCELNLMIAQAQAIDYDNESKNRGAFYPPGGIFVKGHELSILSHRNRLYLIVRNSDRPDIWKLLRVLSELKV
jgi:hypothetical protein